MTRVWGAGRWVTFATLKGSVVALMHPRNDGGSLGGGVWSVFDEFLDGFVGEAHVGAELMDREDLMSGFVEGGFDFQNETAAVALAFAGDALDVFGVNAEAGDSGFHRLFFFAEQSLGIPMNIFR